MLVRFYLEELVAQSLRNAFALLESPEFATLISKADREPR